MRVLVTAGNCSEPVDAVRSITNTSTGRLGASIAAEFVRAGAEVVYLCGLGAALPPDDTPVEVHRVQGVNGLQARLARLLENRRFDCVVHSMAVSDYTVQGTTSAEAAAIHIAERLAAAPPPAGNGPEALAQYIHAALLDLPLLPATEKLGSSMQNPLVLLRQAPKVIAGIKAAQPGTLLVGFKLLAGVSEEQLAAVATGLLHKNGCTLVVANDMDNIHGGEHHALLLDATGILARPRTKAEIASALVNQVTARLNSGTEGD